MKKFKIFNALDIRVSGDKIPCYIIKRKSFGMWFACKNKDFSVFYVFDSDHIVTFSTVLDAEKGIEKVLKTIDAKKTKEKKSYTILNKTVCDYELRILKINDHKENNSVSSKYFIQYKNVFGNWTNATKSKFNSISSTDYLIRNSYDEIIDSLQIITRIIESKKVNKTSQIISSL